MPNLLRRASVAARALLLFIGMLALAAHVPAVAQTGEDGVAGTVTAGDGTPVAGARIALVAAHRSASATSDSSGRFTIAGLPG
ncbi:MAG TPA: carboxypeptidase-like regulatory domain-containing protein, partial [Candidatus Acidoferrales bacterium]|nr:carboxypeptidase-like regulatory domain-containing protein [Candidatus Acidoferrales bacterium]